MLGTRLNSLKPHSTLFSLVLLSANLMSRETRQTQVMIAMYQNSNVGSKTATLPSMSYLVSVSTEKALSDKIAIPEPLGGVCVTGEPIGMMTLYSCMANHCPTTHPFRLVDKFNCMLF
ncbi:unnamed protein product [Periconia digitata]|uniref:Uncharacterized protein n=1 Tax=Periconia digitata TaxID=1303443 RepID=A0A9W4XP50_9PLEO|nr:unnamed protein product [Periconia digitata]